MINGNSCFYIRHNQLSEESINKIFEDQDMKFGIREHLKTTDMIGFKIYYTKSVLFVDTVRSKLQSSQPRPSTPKINIRSLRPDKPIFLHHRKFEPNLFFNFHQLQEDYMQQIHYQNVLTEQEKDEDM